MSIILLQALSGDSTMAAFATHQDLAARLGVTLTSDEQTRATALLALASGLIRSVARQRIELVEDDTLTIRGSGESTYLLPERPVVSVSSVTINGTAADAATWWLEDDTLVRPGGFGSTRWPLVIVYTHGYPADEIPEAIKAVCLEAVVRVWVNPGSVVSERVGSEQTTYTLQGAPTGLLLTADERRAVRHAVRRGARSEVLR